MIVRGGNESEGYESGRMNRLGDALLWGVSDREAARTLDFHLGPD